MNIFDLDATELYAFVNEATLTPLKSSDLIALYNKHTPEAPVKRFADRATAYKRILGRIKEIVEFLEFVGESKPVEVAAAPAVEQPTSDEPVANEPVANEPVANAAEVESRVYRARGLRKPVEVEDDGRSDDEITAEEAAEELRKEIARANSPEALAKKKSLSDSVANSWKDETVAAARKTRNGVVVYVKGETKGPFKSVRVAFAELGLPDSKHIRFRGILKAEKTAVFAWEGVDYSFEIHDVVAGE